MIFPLRVKARAAHSDPVFRRLQRYFRRLFSRPLRVGQCVVVKLGVWGRPGIIALRRGRIEAIEGDTVTVAIDGPVGEIIRKLERGQVR
jgi:hypothetical protein